MGTLQIILIIVAALILILLVGLTFFKKKSKPLFAIKRIIDSNDEGSEKYYQIQGRNEKFSTQEKAENFVRRLKNGSY